MSGTARRAVKTEGNLASAQKAVAKANEKVTRLHFFNFEVVATK